jgi:DNA-binding HxlR family transcriptional regulator
MARTRFADMHCSLARTLELIGDRWSPLILRDVYAGLSRFDQLATDLGISRNLLTARLGDLVDHGLLERRRYQDHPPRDDYVLTPAGRDLVPALMAVIAWGDRWVAPKEGPPVLLKHRGCGAVFEPAVACSVCSERITADDVVPRPGPGGRAALGTAILGQALAPTSDPTG